MNSQLATDIARGMGFDRNQSRFISLFCHLLVMWLELTFFYNHKIWKECLTDFLWSLNKLIYMDMLNMLPHQMCHLNIFFIPSEDNTGRTSAHPSWVHLTTCATQFILKTLQRIWKRKKIYCLIGCALFSRFQTDLLCPGQPMTD